MQYDRWAESYDRRWRRHSAVMHGALLAALDLAGVCDVLDAGCGTGLLITRLSRREPALRVTGLLTKGSRGWGRG